MNNLFSSRSLKLLESVARKRTLFAFDFDGTLAKIVPVPTEARLQPETSSLLAELAERVPTAVISGRSISDLKTRLDVTPGFMIGNHGIEGPVSDGNALKAAEQECQRWKNGLLTYLGGEGDGFEIDVEDKRYSLALHYRRSEDKRKSRKHILEALEVLTPKPRVIPGKALINLVPVGAPHKGTALVSLMMKTKTDFAFYIGDDDTDEDVFSLADPRIFGVRVGQKRSSRAQYFIDRQSRINSLLKILIDFQPTLAGVP